MLVAAAVAFAFYAPSLRFGFFNDDPTGHFRWMEGRSIWSLLTDASSHGYYRPASFILWQLLHTLLGRHDPFTLHLLNVLAHSADAALIVWLAYRLTGRLAYAALAGALFALYPFSYEAVPYVGSFVHPLVSLLILLTLAFYVHWRQDNARWAFVAAHVTLMLAVFTQENAVITPLLVLAVSLFVRPSSLALLPTKEKEAHSLTSVGRGAITPATFSFFVEPAVFAAAWLLVPKTAEVRTISLTTVLANVLPFVQALVYPVAPLANHNPTMLVFLAVLSLVVLFTLAWRVHGTRMFVFGLVIWALASLPSILILDNAYVLGSPRLFYLPSVGAALIWALPVLGLGNQRPEIESRRSEVRNWISELGIGTLVLAACYLPSAGYSRCQLVYQGMAGEIGRMMAGAARSALPGQGVTFVNLPYFFSSRGKGTECRNPFVFAPTGAVVVPPYADARDFVRYNGGPDISASAITVREYQPGWQTFGAQARVEQVRQQLAASRVFVFDLVRWRFFDLSAAWQPDAPANQAQAILNGVTISNFKFQMTNGKSVATLTWQSAAMIQDRQVFVHVYDSSGKLAAQADSAPAEGFVPTSWWRAGDVITDVHSVNTTNLPSGVYRVTVGMYDAATGTRIEARDASGIRLPDDEVIIGKVTR